MLITGRHPQTTGHIINSTRTRHTEISIADAFAAQGYRTGWIGKWHLHTGVWPAQNVPDWVPEGRDRMGFQYWRAYNMHMVYFNGFVNGDDWNFEQWEGYAKPSTDTRSASWTGWETTPFCLFMSPHQPHATPFDYASDDCYERVPENLALPENVPEEWQGRSRKMYRDYLAMVIALDNMIGQILDYLDRTGKADNTLLVFTSDHGTQVGAQGLEPWAKKHPYEESMRVPCTIRLPGALEGGIRRDTLTAPVDFFPTLCSLCDVPIPCSVEGCDLSDSWLGEPNPVEQEAVLTMNFSRKYDHFEDGLEWRGIRTKQYAYARWLNGLTELFDLESDPLEMNNLAESPTHSDLREEMESHLARLQTKRGDVLHPCEHYRTWLDSQRRVIRNAFGPLSNPEGEPDWSLLE